MKRSPRDYRINYQRRWISLSVPLSPFFFTVKFYVRREEEDFVCGINTKKKIFIKKNC